jgi:hypothetical protein
VTVSSLKFPLLRLEILEEHVGEGIYFAFVSVELLPTEGKAHSMDILVKERMMHEIGGHPGLESDDTFGPVAISVRIGLVVYEGYDLDGPFSTTEFETSRYTDHV